MPNQSGDQAPTYQEILPFVTVAINNGGNEAAGLADCTAFYEDEERQRITQANADVAQYQTFIRDEEFYYVDGLELGTARGLFPFMVGDGSLNDKVLTRHNNLINSNESDTDKESRFRTSKQPEPSVSADGLTVETKNTPTADVVYQIVDALPITDPLGDPRNPKAVYRLYVQQSGSGWQYNETSLATVTAEWERGQAAIGDDELEQSKAAMNADYMNTVYNPAVGDPSVTLEQLRASSESFYANYVVN